MHEAILKQLGLTDDQITIYETLLKTGPVKASKLAQKTPFKRVLVYKLLNDLVEMKLVERDKESQKVALFRPAHPLALEQLVEAREKQLQNVQKTLKDVLPSLISEFNLSSGKPGVRFFEGKDGIIKIYEELLDENAPIDSIEDKGEMTKFFPEYIPSWVKRRIQRKIVNRAISPTGNPLNWTDPKRFLYSRNIAVEKYPLSMDVKIVNNKVSLVTFQKETAIGVVIDHPEIAHNFRLIFQFMWDALGEGAENKAVQAAEGQSMPSNTSLEDESGGGAS